LNWPQKELYKLIFPNPWNFSKGDARFVSGRVKIIHPTLRISSMFHAAGIDAGGVGKDRGFIIGMVWYFCFTVVV